MSTDRKAYLKEYCSRPEVIEKRRKYMETYYAERAGNKERKARYDKRYYSQKRDRKAEQWKRWYAANAENRRKYKQELRAKKHGKPRFTRKDIHRTISELRNGNIEFSEFIRRCEERFITKDEIASNKRDK